MNAPAKRMTPMKTLRFTIPAAALLGMAVATNAAHAQASPNLPAPLTSGTWIASGPSPAASSGHSKGGVAVLPQTGMGKLSDPFPSGEMGSPEKPLTSQKMPVSGAAINQQINRVIRGADERLSGVSLETGEAAIKPVSQATLAEDIEAANRIHRIEVKRAEVAAATALWGAAYDGKRENPAPAQAATGTAMGGIPGAIMPTNGAIPVAQAISLAEKRNQEAKEAEAARDAEAQAEALKRRDSLSNAIRAQKKAMLDALPVVSSVVGSPEDAEATILVPYVGVQRGMRAGSVIKMYGGRTARIVSVTDRGVYASVGGKSVLLEEGSGVPSLAQANAETAQIEQTFAPPPPAASGPDMMTVGRPPSPSAFKSVGAAASR